jgi:hypothetical protein
MSEQKRQAPISRKEEKRKQEEEEEDHVEYVASEQDRQIEASNTKTTIHQDNAIQHVAEGENTTTNITTTTTANNFHLMTKEEEDLTIKMRNAGDALYYLVLSAIEKAKTISSQKVKELVTRDISPAAIAAKKDAHDISTLGEYAEWLARTFESLMTEMRKQPYSEQVHLLTGYRKLLKEQINVIDSRISMVKRLIK